LADRFAELPWCKQLTRWARKVNPLLMGRRWLAGMNYYWVGDFRQFLFSRTNELEPRYARYHSTTFPRRSCTSEKKTPGNRATAMVGSAGNHDTWPSLVALSLCERQAEARIETAMALDT
jgi:hypothetical protein